MDFFDRAEPVIILCLGRSLRSGSDAYHPKRWFEQCRVLGDSQPPWSFLRVYRYLEGYGVVSVANIYTFSLIGWWKVDENGKLVPYPTLEEQGITIKNREQALRLLTEGEIKGKLEWAPFYGAKYKNDLVTKVVKQWKCDAAIIHLNRGCEGTAQHQMELKIALQNMGFLISRLSGLCGRFLFLWTYCFLIVFFWY